MLVGAARKAAVPAILAMFALNALAQIPERQVPEDTANSTYRDAKGTRCERGPGVTLCPKVKSFDGMSPGKVSNRRLNMQFGFCVSEKGRPEDVVLTQSSGNSKYDDRVMRWFKKARYTPGTINGIDARICGMVFDHITEPVSYG